MESGLAAILQKLPQRPAWKSSGSLLLQQKARAYFRITCALMYAGEGQQRTAISRILASLYTYPLPLLRKDTTVSLLRP